jgi:hypothetical protein
VTEPLVCKRAVVGVKVLDGEWVVALLRSAERLFFNGVSAK